MKRADDPIVQRELRECFARLRMPGTSPAMRKFFWDQIDELTGKPVRKQ